MIARWTRLSPSRRLLLLEAVAGLVVASTAVRLLAFKRAVRIGSIPILGDAISDTSLVEDVRWAVEAAARRVPWRAVCIQQGIALQRMLRRRGVDARLHYGVGHGEGGKLQAHVWVAAGDRIVIGGEQAPQYRRLASYP